MTYRHTVWQQDKIMMIVFILINCQVQCTGVERTKFYLHSSCRTLYGNSNFRFSGFRKVKAVKKNCSSEPCVCS